MNKLVALLCLLIQLMVACGLSTARPSTSSGDNAASSSVRQEPNPLAYLNEGASFVIPAVPALDVGLGYDTLSATPKARCISFDRKTFEEVPSEIPARQLLKLVHVTSADEFASQFELGVAGSFGIGIYSVDASAQYLRTAKISRYAEHLVLSSTIENERSLLHSWTLTPEAEAAYKEGPNAFAELCGDSVIVGKITGGEFTATIRAESSTEEEQKQVRAALKASAMRTSIDVNAAQMLEQLQSKARLSVEMTRIGPANEELPAGMQNIVSYARSYPQKVSAHKGVPWTTHYIYAKWNSRSKVPASAWTDRQVRFSNESASLIRRLYERLAGLRYIKMNQGEFGPFAKGCLSSKILETEANITNLRHALNDCLVDANKCIGTEGGQITLPPLPDRVGAWSSIDSKQAIPKKIASSQGSGHIVLELAGFWHPHCPNKAWKLGGDVSKVMLVDRKTGQERSVSYKYPFLVPGNTDVFFMVGDGATAAAFVDNCSDDSDPLRYRIFEPVCPSEYDVP